MLLSYPGCSDQTKPFNVIQTKALRIALGLPQWTPNIVLMKLPGQEIVSEKIRRLANKFFLSQISNQTFSPLYSNNPGSLNLKIMKEDKNNIDRMATDASKNEYVTSIAGVTENLSFAYRINHNNSIFTAEALAICQAIDDLAVSNKNLLILADSLSVLYALQNYSIKSHSVIHRLARKIYIRSNYTNQLILLWTPGHSKILWNEQADYLARSVTESDVYIEWIASEDINRKIYQERFKTANDNFFSSKYFENLGNIPSISIISKWTNTRREEILCTRIFSKMIITPGLLHKFNLSDNAICRSCNCINDLDHILLSCNRYTDPRNHLKSFLKIDLHCNTTFKELLEKAISNRSTFQFFIQKFKYFGII
ncbi:putative RNA-directed DNA polymerase from transposon X-element [Trichonephila clavipes]|nr:putative RNA-directed DNA polymerase from transposon X-element [Trichonephila clavipes]